MWETDSFAELGSDWQVKLRQVLSLLALLVQKYKY
jgi:hypothetical protein